MGYILMKYKINEIFFMKYQRSNKEYNGRVIPITRSVNKKTVFFRIL